MAKPIKLITEVTGDDAKRFVKELKKTKPNPKRVAIIKKARELPIVFA